MLVNPFQDMPFSTALGLLTTNNTDRLLQLSSALVNRYFYDGDHWQNATGWIGPVLSSESTASQDILAEIKKIFCSRNVIKEVVDRKVDGLLKRRPRTDFVLKENTQTTSIGPESESDRSPLIDEANSFFNAWMVKKALLTTLKEVYGRSQLGEGPIVRIYIPRGYIENGKLPPGTVEECLDKIYVEVIYGSSVGEIIDQDTQFKAVVAQTSVQNRTYTELVYRDGEDTVLRVLNSGDPTEQVFIWPLGGRLTMWEPKLKPCIDDQVRQNQIAINFFKTLLNRNGVTGGFVERILLDAMPPGHWEPNPDAPGDDRYVVEPFKVGAGTTNFFMGARYRDEITGESKTGSPSVFFREPASPQVFVDSARCCYQDIMEQVGQPHVLISGYATTSGTSREEAREIFMGTLDDDEGEFNALLAWIMETVMALAAYLAHEPDRYATLKADAQCYITSGPMIGTERQDLRESVRTGLLSRETAMVRDGVEDPRAELDRISNELSGSLLSLQQQATILNTLRQAGCELEGALELMGIPKALITKLLPAVGTGVAPVLPNGNLMPGSQPGAGNVPAHPFQPGNPPGITKAEEVGNVPTNR